MSVPNSFSAVTSATGKQLDDNFAACLQLDEANKLTNALNHATSVVLASASTVNIGAAASNNITISGAVQIDAFDTIAEGALRLVTFTGAPLVTYNVTSMQLIGGASRTMAAGDTSLFRSLGGGNWKEELYNRFVEVPVSLTGQLRSDAGVLSVGASLIAFTTITSTNATWSPNAKTTKIVVQVIAGGGVGGAGASFNGSGGNGGRQGQTKWGVSTSVSGTYAATIGASATNSSFIGTGISVTALAGDTGTAGQAVGSMTNGLNGSMGDGYGGGTAGTGGAGGAGGVGGAGAANSGAGGGGGGGSSDGTAGAAGGAGGSGVIYVWEYA